MFPWRPGNALIVAVGLAMASALGASVDGLGVQRACVFLMLAPLFEEAVFRAGLQEGLLRHGFSKLSANVLAALAFALVHAVVRGVALGLLVAVPALLIGALYERWGRLRVCVAVHSLFNGVWLAWSLTNLPSPFAR